MNFILKLFQSKPKYFSVLTKLGPELSERYGSSSSCYQGQIDKTMKDLGIGTEQSVYAYVLYLRDEDYLTLQTNDPETFQRIEKEIGDYLESRPTALGKGDFYESRIGMSSGMST